MPDVPGPIDDVERLLVLLAWRAQLLTTHQAVVATGLDWQSFMLAYTEAVQFGRQAAVRKAGDRKPQACPRAAQ